MLNIYIFEDVHHICLHFDHVEFINQNVKRNIYKTVEIIHIYYEYLCSVCEQIFFFPIRIEVLLEKVLYFPERSSSFIKCEFLIDFNLKDHRAVNEFNCIGNAKCN